MTEKETREIVKTIERATIEIREDIKSEGKYLQSWLAALDRRIGKIEDRVSLGRAEEETVPKKEEGHLGKRMADTDMRIVPIEREALEKKCSGVTDTARGGQDPYLQTGWPCEVWDDDTKELMYFLGFLDGKRYFYYKTTKGSQMELCGKREGAYKPLGTEWESNIAPEWAERIVISSYGGVCFVGAMASVKVGITSVLPEKYYGRTIPRPEWAKE